MRVYLDLDTRRILTTSTRPATRLEFKRRDNDAFDVQFLRAGAVQELPAGTTARVGLKATDDFAGGFLATDTLTQSGSGSDTFYSGEFNLNTTAIEALFGDEPASISAMLEVEWTTGTLVGSSLTLPVLVHNDVIRGNEGTPATLPLFYTSETSDFLATTAEAEAGTDNTKWMSPLRTAEAIAALGGAGGVSSYNDLTDIPTEFPPVTHSHSIADTTGLQTALETLQTTLDGKASSTHPHALSDLTQSAATIGQVATWNGTAWVPQTPATGTGGGVTSYNDLTDVPTTFAPDAHNHIISDTSGLQDALDAKQDAGDYAAAAHTHAATDITSGTLALARIPTGTTSSTVALGDHSHTFGTSSGTFCEGNDARLSDARTPASHPHGNITNSGAIGTTSGLPIITGTSGALQAGSFGTTAGTFCQGNDARLLNISGGITAIAVVTTMPATPTVSTLYIVTG